MHLATNLQQPAVTPSYRLLALLLLAATLAACNFLPDGPGVPAAEPGNLVGTSWKLVAFQDAQGRRVSIPAGEAYSLRFDTDSTLSGQAVCNTYYADYEAVDAALSISPVSATLALCSKGVISTPYLAALGEADRYDLAGGRLRIRFGESGILTYR